jgi:hypothetical protein
MVNHDRSVRSSTLRCMSESESLIRKTWVVTLLATLLSGTCAHDGSLVWQSGGDLGAPSFVLRTPVEPTAAGCL